MTANAKKEDQSIRQYIYDLVENIKPFDAIERTHINETLSWISVGAPLFRIQSPDIPDQHLVSYFVVFDEMQNKILLVDHIKANLWLPPGGHVEMDEDPKDTVIRECMEELGVVANFWTPEPLFLTSSLTVNMDRSHKDISLWYVIKGDSFESLKFDQAEFNQIAWFGFDEVPFERTDPHLKRFLWKFKTLL